MGNDFCCSNLNESREKALLAEINPMPPPKNKIFSSAAKIKKNFNKKSKIVIIGAGPSGIHMASELIKSGYKNVHILEKTERYGGKAYTIRDKQGVPHEMGTCYMHPQYTYIRELIKEYDPDNKEMEIVTGVLSDRIRKSEGNKDEKEQIPIPLGDFVLNETEYQFIDERFHWLNDLLSTGFSIIAAVKKYESAYKNVFGNDMRHIENGFGFLPKPRNMSMIDMNFLEFLKRNDCLEIWPILLYSNVSQGYGLLDEIPAYYGLLWNRPDVLHEIIDIIDQIKRKIGNKYFQPMLYNGFESLWNKIVKKHNINIRLNMDIKYINRHINNGNKQIVITVNNWERIKCDVLFIAMNQKYALPIYDATNEEKDVFNGLNAYTLCTTLYESNIENDILSPPEFGGEIMPEAILRAKGELYAHRQCVRVVRPELVGTLKKDVNVAYQFYNTEPNGMLGDEKEKNDAKKLLMKDLIKWGESGVKLKDQLYWSYFPKWDNKDVMKGYPWKVRDEMQGKIKNTFYIGSSVCFESILHVISYNRELLVQLGIN